MNEKDWELSDIALDKFWLSTRVVPNGLRIELVDRESARMYKCTMQGLHSIDCEQFLAQLKAASVFSENGVTFLRVGFSRMELLGVDDSDDVLRIRRLELHNAELSERVRALEDEVKGYRKAEVDRIRKLEARVEELCEERAHMKVENVESSMEAAIESMRKALVFGADNPFLSIESEQLRQRVIRLVPRNDPVLLRRNDPKAVRDVRNEAERWTEIFRWLKTSR